jgi:ABC-type lipoprotein export system ATPase subunit
MMMDGFSHETVDGAPWAFIAVMGVTGAGKSTFIQWASGSDEIVIGHDLESCKSSFTALSSIPQICIINALEIQD